MGGDNIFNRYRVSTTKGPRRYFNYTLCDDSEVTAGNQGVMMTNAKVNDYRLE